MKTRIFIVGALTALLTAIIMPSIVERKISGTAFQPENIGLLPVIALVGGGAAFLAARGAKVIS